MGYFGGWGQCLQAAADQGAHGLYLDASLYLGAGLPPSMVAGSLLDKVEAVAGWDPSLLL